ncbi:hypothetical protein NDU88_002027 [Pleurodeles waltl]|uniref:Uncharacterized protein n=1 Tax=Pleurodeles waltl TaxID=8319 RepID=A0AAV7TKM0_PLEWA|nr:hypothetical protein NDU88_002027 [Pleurodeles waltl]
MGGDKASSTAERETRVFLKEADRRSDLRKRSGMLRYRPVSRAMKSRARSADRTEIAVRTRRFSRVRQRTKITCRGVGGVEI